MGFPQYRVLQVRPRRVAQRPLQQGRTPSPFEGHGPRTRGEAEGEERKALSTHDARERAAAARTPRGEDDAEGRCEMTPRYERVHTVEPEDRAYRRFCSDCG